MSIGVYGTAFNVNTHGLRATETILVEGEIGISGKGSTRRAADASGQLAACDHHSGEITFRKWISGSTPPGKTGNFALTTTPWRRFSKSWDAGMM
ncbi:MAG: hypothetical protein ACLUOS_08135 [Odoribacter splanchnicus]